MKDNLAYFLIFIFTVSSSLSTGAKADKDLLYGVDGSLSTAKLNERHSHTRALIESDDRYLNLEAKLDEENSKRTNKALKDEASKAKLGGKDTLPKAKLDETPSQRNDKALFLAEKEVNGTLWTSPMEARAKNSTQGNKGVLDRLFKLGEYFFNIFDDDDDDETENNAEENENEEGSGKDVAEPEDKVVTSANKEVEGRARKMDIWMYLVPLYKGFFLAGLTTAAFVVIKLFIVQSFVASKLALILGFYLVLEKLARNIAAQKSTTRKILYHSEPQYMFNLPQPTYSVSHTTGEIDIEHLNHQPHSSATDTKSHYSGYTDVKPFSYDGRSEGKNTLSQTGYSDELKPVALPYSVMENQEAKSYDRQAETHETNAYQRYPENPISDQATYEMIPAELIHSSSYEQIPAMMVNSYSINDSANQPSNDQYYYASPPNATAPGSSTTDLQKTPIHVIAADSPASRPIGRRVFRKLPIVHHKQKQRY